MALAAASMLAGTIGLAGVSAAAAQPPTPPILDAHAVAQARFGGHAPWDEGNTPLFESSDPPLDQIYYYRWKLFRAGADKLSC